MPLVKRNLEGGDTRFIAVTSNGAEGGETGLPCRLVKRGREMTIHKVKDQVL